MGKQAKDVRAVLVTEAREEAAAEGLAAVEAEHLLLGLARYGGTAAYRMLQAAGLDRAAIRRILEAEWEESLAVAGVRVRVAELPEPRKDTSRSIGIGASARVALRRAMEHSAATGGGRITSLNMLAGVLSGRHDRVARALDTAGVDRARLVADATRAVERGEH